MATIRMLATQNVWAPDDHIGGGDSPDVEWLETLQSPTPPPDRPPWRPAFWQVLAGDSSTNWAPDHKPYNTVPRGSLPLPGELPSTWDPNPMIIKNYRAVTVTISARLPFPFRWLVGDAELTIGLV